MRGSGSQLAGADGQRVEILAIQVVGDEPVVIEVEIQVATIGGHAINVSPIIVGIAVAHPEIDRCKLVQPHDGIALRQPGVAVGQREVIDQSGAVHLAALPPPQKVGISQVDAARPDK